MKPMSLAHPLTASTALVALLCALPSDVRADAQPISEHRAATASARVSINNVRGQIRVTGWERNEVQVGGTLGEGSKLEITGDDGSIDIRVNNDKEGSGWSWWGGNGPKSDTVLLLHVPRGASLDVSAVSADVEVDGIAGSREVGVESVSGDVQVSARAERWSISSVSGDIVARGEARNAQVETVSGDITADGVSGELTAETVSGTAHLVAGKVSRLNASSVSGDLRIELAPMSGSRVDVESMSGDVGLTMPADLSARIEAETFSGSIHSDFGEVVDEEHGPGSRLRATVGGGDATINAETFSGDLELRRR
jgi:DUF4097 and DUF4098 domain-containing protein YvlB